MTTIVIVAARMIKDIVLPILGWELGKWAARRWS